MTIIFFVVLMKDLTLQLENAVIKKSVELRNYMKKKVTSLKLGKIRVNQSGCLDQCENGPIMVIYPQGVWYKYKNFEDVDEIINSHLIKGKIVKRLLLKT